MKSVSVALVAAIALMIVASTAQAVTFDPLFRITSVSGDCQVMPKGEKAFQAVKAGKAYHYGSHVRTGRKSSLIIVLSDGNECQVLADADLVMNQDTKNSKLKIINLKSGTVDINLDPAFEESGYGLQVETAAAICGVIGSVGSVNARSDNKMSVTTLGIKEGKFWCRSKNDHFKVVEMDADDWISVACSVDREFTRIKNIKGSYTINCKDSAGDMQTIDLKLNGIVKIWARRAPVGDNVTVTIIFTSPNGKIEQAFTYTEVDGRTPGEVDEDVQGIRDDIRAQLDDNSLDDTAVTTTTTTTTTVSTSTTIPNVTNAGRR
jgi:hypothetical protein